MSKRWKYQIKFGLFTAVYMTFMTSIFPNKESFVEQIYNYKFYYVFLLYLILGIFVFGYGAWKANDKKNNSWNSWSTLFYRLGFKKNVNKN